MEILQIFLELGIRKNIVIDLEWFESEFEGCCDEVKRRIHKDSRDSFAGEIFFAQFRKYDQTWSSRERSFLLPCSLSRRLVSSSFLWGPARHRSWQNRGREKYVREGQKRRFFSIVLFFALPWSIFTRWQWYCRIFLRPRPRGTLNATLKFEAAWTEVKECIITRHKSKPSPTRSLSLFFFQSLAFARSPSLDALLYFSHVFSSSFPFSVQERSEQRNAQNEWSQRIKSSKHLFRGLLVVERVAEIRSSHPHKTPGSHRSSSSFALASCPPRSSSYSFVRSPSRENFSNADAARRKNFFLKPITQTAGLDVSANHPAPLETH